MFALRKTQFHPAFQSSVQNTRLITTPMAQALTEVFHHGEVRAQELTGVRQHVVDVGLAAFIRPAMPAQHQDFFCSLPLMYLSSMGQDGRMWASVVAGQPGFVSSPNAKQLVISPLHVNTGDPLAQNLAVGAHLGGLGLELHTRRRNRINTHVTHVDMETVKGEGGRVELGVELSFGNCPKYIQGRNLVFDWSRLGEVKGNVYKGGAQLGPAQERQVSSSDTLFLATCFTGPAGPGTSPNAVGCDVSHRGGPGGFVLVESGPEGGTVLKWAEYVGNNMFQSLGNLLTNPRAGLLFIDYTTGDTLQLTGTASVDYQDTSLPGALRVASFTVEQWVHVPHALPVRQVGPIDWSRFNPEPHPAQLTATKTASQDTGPAPAVPVTCVSVTDAAVGVKTFEFQLPQGSGAALPGYSGGQYATFLIPGLTDDPQAALVQRTWTVSSHPDTTKSTGTFTITVKRSGLVSSHLHDHLKAGGALMFRGFGGDFTAQLALAAKPAEKAAGPLPGCLLLAGGIGITPLRPILQDLVNAALTSHGFRSGTEVVAGHNEGGAATITNGIQSKPAGGSTWAEGAAGDAPLVAPARLVLAYWVRGVEEAALAREMHQLAESAAARSNGRVQVQLILSTTRGPLAAPASPVGCAECGCPGHRLGPLWQQTKGRLSARFLAEHVMGSNGSLAGWHVFTCGPPGFLAIAEQAAQELGASMGNVHTESFNF